MSVKKMRPSYCTPCLKISYIGFTGASSRRAGMTSRVNKSREVRQASRGIPGTEKRQTRCLRSNSFRKRVISSSTGSRVA